MASRYMWLHCVALFRTFLSSFIRHTQRCKTGSCKLQFDAEKLFENLQNTIVNFFCPFLIFNNISTKLQKTKFCFSDRYGRSGIESRWGRDFPPVQTGPGAHPASCTMGTESFPGVKCGRGVLLTTQTLLAPRSRKSTAIPLPTLWATPGL